MTDHNNYTRKRIKDLFKKNDDELNKPFKKPIEKNENTNNTNKKGFVKCPDGKYRWVWGKSDRGIKS